MSSSMLPRCASPPSNETAASAKSGPASRFHTPNCTTLTARPSVVAKFFPNAPANHSACTSCSDHSRAAAAAPSRMMAHSRRSE
jgi:hypothetical protein